MSKNTNISELINYISYDGSGNIVFTTVSAAATNTDKFLVSDAGTLKFRTAAQLLSDIGAQASGSYQAALSGTGFVKISGSTISYDNSTYATQTYVGTAISNLVASSPATLDTLNELALALGSDPNFATTVATSIGTKQPQLNGTGFVKVTGTTISYDNSIYLTTSSASSTYLPLSGGTLTGPLSGTSATFNPNASSILTLTSAGTNASIIKAGSGDELYLGGNDTWQMRFSGGNILMDNGGNVSIGTSTIGYKLFVSTTSTGAFNLNSVNSTVGGPMIDFYDTGRSQETVISSYDGGTVGTYIASYSNHPLMFGTYAGSSPSYKMIIGANGKVGINDGLSTNAQLALNGSVKINRSLYNWYQESYVGNSTYLHIKTNLWAGGSPNGNTEYTMSLFKGYMYAYGTPPALEGTIVFHNWDGSFYNIGTTGNLFVTAYRSADGYVVLVTNSGSGEAGLTIDWHQAYGYPYKDRIRTASKLHGATSGGY